MKCKYTENETLRPIIINGGRYKNVEGFFHSWGQWIGNGTEADSHAIIELMDGTCEVVPVLWLKFTDR